MAESLENTGFEGCVGFSANYTQTIHKTRFLKILKKFQKKYCKVFYNVILFNCSKGTTKIKKKRRLKQMLITKEMYERAKEVEKAEDELYSLENWDDDTPEYIKWDTLYDKFYEDYKIAKNAIGNGTNDIVRRYEKQLNNIHTFVK